MLSTFAFSQERSISCICAPVCRGHRNSFGDYRFKPVSSSCERVVCRPFIQVNDPRGHSLSVIGMRVSLLRLSTTKYRQSCPWRRLKTRGPSTLAPCMVPLIFDDNIVFRKWQRITRQHTTSVIFTAASEAGFVNAYRILLGDLHLTFSDFPRLLFWSSLPDIARIN